VANDIIAYIEMCRREDTSLQQGMNFGLGGNHSVVLMSLRRNARYRDSLEDGGTTLIYQGHDEPRGIWSYNAVFHLVDSWRERDEYRSVFKFRLVAVEGEEDFSVPPSMAPVRRRILPTAVKLAVWKRDGGKCVVCGASDELHFDHDLPWSVAANGLRTVPVSQ